ncbi:hypothetical protein BDV23DRAFT_165497 [Aspergillus alliaceus]|uniref:Uncharacterized protein n=1 Tax=Petromyces alliaceus TaxID=209559 RepID=A0A5N7BTH0_PETAA|nr:hypothetical protein BDV23DRAFT_165497 [Aspergillus alliaceus]
MHACRAHVCRPFDSWPPADAYRRGSFRYSAWCLVFILVLSSYSFFSDREQDREWVGTCNPVAQTTKEFGALPFESRYQSSRVSHAPHLPATHSL